MASHAGCAGPAWVDHDNAGIHGLFVRADVGVEVLLESHCEVHERKLRCGVDTASLELSLPSLAVVFLGARFWFEVWHFASHVCAACTEDDPDVAVWRLGTDCRTEDAEEVKVRHVV